ncbi:hypothetical protein SAMN05444360_12140 [Chryseobacterium carnipullorum]|nr:hypothetical protein SAMN05444360_12140 [Chryseobacterium carnipullorum]
MCIKSLFLQLRTHLFNDKTQNVEILMKKKWIQLFPTFKRTSACTMTIINTSPY